MIRTMVYDRNSGECSYGDSSTAGAWQPSSDNWIWVDIDAESTDAERALLRDRFGIDPLAIADAQRDRHPPKLEYFDDHYFLLLKGLDSESGELHFGTIQLAFFVGTDYLITRRTRPSVSTDRIWREAERHMVELQHGPHHVACRIARLMADRYTNVVLEMERRLDELEDEMFRHPSDALLAELMDYNGNLKKFRRIFTYHRDILDQLANADTEWNPPSRRREFNDVYEQMERLASLSNLFQELTVDLMNGYMSLSAHRLNQIMKVLTIATVIFLPLGILAGIYGMNFENMPELGWKYGYFAVLGTMATVVVTLIIVFRRVRWL